MTTDLRALLETWRGRVQMPRNEYDSGRQIAYEQASDELQAVLDAQAGMVCVGWEWSDTRDGFGWMRLNMSPEATPEPYVNIQYRRIFAQAATEQIGYQFRLQPLSGSGKWGAVAFSDAPMPFCTTHEYRRIYAGPVEGGAP